MKKEELFKGFVQKIGTELNAEPTLIEAVNFAVDTMLEYEYTAPGKETISDPMLRGYLEAMLFTGVETGEEEPDYNMSIIDLSSDALTEATKDCKEFEEVARDLISVAVDERDGYTMEHVGHDFWLTRNGHGAGFWDRGLSIGKELTDIAKTFGEKFAYLGDDGKVYLG